MTTEFRARIKDPSRLPPRGVIGIRGTHPSLTQQVPADGQPSFQDFALHESRELLAIHAISSAKIEPRFPCEGSTRDTEVVRQVWRRMATCSRAAIVPTRQQPVCDVTL